MSPRSPRSSSRGAPDSKAAPRERLHRGRTVAERKAERRQALLDAALDLFGTKGYPATPIEELCRASFVSTRYFYEEFSNREDLLASLYEQLLERAWAAVLAAGVDDGPDFLRREIHSRVGAFVHALLDDPRAARVVCLEAVGVSPAFEARRRAAHLFYADTLATFFASYFPEGREPDHDFELVALGMVGAINEIIIDWMERDDQPSLDELIDVVGELFIVLGTSRFGRHSLESNPRPATG
jgi:AcrR family transcriptional regulator